MTRTNEQRPRTKTAANGGTRAPDVSACETHTAARAYEASTLCALAASCLGRRVLNTCNLNAKRRMAQAPLRIKLMDYYT